MVAKASDVSDPNSNDFIYPYFSWDYFYYIAPAVAIFLILCVLASYCFRLCQSPRGSNFETSSALGSFRRRRRNNNNNATTRNNNQRQDPYVNGQFFPWNYSRRQRMYNRMEGHNNGQVSGIGHQYYPPATNPLFNEQVRCHAYMVIVYWEAESCSVFQMSVCIW